MTISEYVTRLDGSIGRNTLADTEMAIMPDGYSDHTDIILSVDRYADMERRTRYAVTLSYQELVEAVRAYNACSNGPPAG
jgi:hypothetical protein